MKILPLGNEWNFFRSLLLDGSTLDTKAPLLPSMNLLVNDGSEGPQYCGMRLRRILPTAVNTHFRDSAS